MKRPLFALLWVALVLLTSAYILTRLDRYYARHEQQAEYEGEKATVMLIGYGGEQFPGIEQSGSYLRVGCQDMLVTMDIPVISPRLESVLTALMIYVPPLGLHNPAMEKGLVFRSAQKDIDGRVIIDFEGELQFGGVCDTPRFKEQLEETIKLHAPKFEIRLNGSESAYRCLGDLKGDCT